MRSTEHFEDCVSVSNKSSESVDSVLYDPTYTEQHGQSNYTSECDSPPASSSGLHLSDDADSMLSEAKLDSSSRSPTVSSVKMYSLSANNSPYLGRKNLVSENGTIIWDADDDWIQQYDKMLRMTNCTQRKRACGCLLKRSSEINYQSVLSSPQHFRRGTVVFVCLLPLLCLSPFGLYQFALRSAWCLHLHDWNLHLYTAPISSVQSFDSVPAQSVLWFCSALSHSIIHSTHIHLCPVSETSDAACLHGQPHSRRCSVAHSVSAYTRALPLYSAGALTNAFFEVEFILYLLVCSQG